jgi:hypothetical protein
MLQCPRMIWASWAGVAWLKSRSVTAKTVSVAILPPRVRRHRRRSMACRGVREGQLPGWADHLDRPGLDPAVTGVRARESSFHVLPRQAGELPGQGGSVRLDDQHVVRTPPVQILRVGVLCMHGIRGQDNVLQVEWVQQRLERGDLVRLRVHGDLPVHDAGRVVHRSDQVHCAAVVAARTPGALAVHRQAHQPVVSCPVRFPGAYPGAQHRVQQVRVHPEHDPPDRGRRRHPPGGTSGFVQVSDPFRDSAVGPGASDHGRQRQPQPQHRLQLEPEPLPAPRVRQHRQHLDQRAHPLSAYIFGWLGSLNDADERRYERGHGGLHQVAADFNTPHAAA